jgi:hypothetical protein
MVGAGVSLMKLQRQIRTNIAALPMNGSLKNRFLNIPWQKPPAFEHGFTQQFSSLGTVQHHPSFRTPLNLSSSAF